MSPRLSVALVGLLLPVVAHAEIDPKCADLPKPPDYDERVQQDFQQNYFALTSSYSPIHGAVPHEPGHGSIGVDVNVMPPLSCEKRFVLEWTKTEDTNKSPILPKIHAGYAFPAIAKILVPYASVAFLPPIPVGGTRTLVISGEVGFGVMAHEHVDVGARFHTTLMRTYGDVATAFDPETEPVVEDVYSGSTWGFDALVSFPFDVGQQQLVPFVAGGYTNASTFFFVGDNGYVANNFHPYSGAALSAGLDVLLAKRVRIGGEYYGAPGGYSLPDKSVESVEKGTRYGNLHTARFRLSIEI